jgi:hypothetical protein
MKQELLVSIEGGKAADDEMRSPSNGVRIEARKAVRMDDKKEERHINNSKAYEVL